MIVQIVLVLKIIRYLFPRPEGLAPSTVAFVALLPMQIYFSPFISNEVFSSLAITAALFLLIFIVREKRFRIGPSVALGSAVGLACLSKYSGFLLAFTACFAYAVFFVAQVERRTRLIVSFLTASLVFIAFTGPYYLRNVKKYGELLPVNVEFQKGFTIEYFDLPYPVSIAIGMIATAVISVVVGKFVMQRIVGAPPETGVLATLGIALVLQNTVILVFGGGYKFFSGGYIEPVSIFGFTLAEQRVLIIIVCILVFVGLELMVSYSRMGKAMRAVSQNIECCAVVGIDVPQVALRTFILGACLAALSGVLTAPVNVSVYGGMGEIITFKTLPVIIMGGLGNVRGTFFAAMILGIAESLVATYVGLQFRDTVGFATLMLVLMWRPHGLFSAQARF